MVKIKENKFKNFGQLILDDLGKDGYDVLSRQAVKRFFRIWQLTDFAIINASSLVKNRYSVQEEGVYSYSIKHDCDGLREEIEEVIMALRGESPKKKIERIDFIGKSIDFGKESWIAFPKKALEFKKHSVAINTEKNSVIFSDNFDDLEKLIDSDEIQPMINIEKLSVNVKKYEAAKSEALGENVFAFEIEPIFVNFFSKEEDGWSERINGFVLTGEEADKFFERETVIGQNLTITGLTRNKERDLEESLKVTEKGFRYLTLGEFGLDFDKIALTSVNLETQSGGIRNEEIEKKNEEVGKKTIELVDAVDLEIKNSVIALGKCDQLNNQREIHSLKQIIKNLREIKKAIWHLRPSNLLVDKELNDEKNKKISKENDERISKRKEFIKLFTDTLKALDVVRKVIKVKGEKDSSGSEGSVPEVPKGSVPEVPKGSVPEVPKGSVPEVPEGSVPEVPEGSVPEVPEGSVPEVVRKIEEEILSDEGDNKQQSFFRRCRESAGKGLERAKKFASSKLSSLIGKNKGKNEKGKDFELDKLRNEINEEIKKSGTVEGVETICNSMKARVEEGISRISHQPNNSSDSNLGSWIIGIGICVVFFAASVLYLKKKRKREEKFG